MVRVLNRPNAHEAIIAVKERSLFYFGGTPPEGIGDLVRMDRIATGEIRIMAKTDIVLLVDGLWDDPCTGARSVFFIRNDRSKEGVGSLRVPKFHPMCRLREALIYENIPCVEVIGGFDRVLVHDDELAVPDASLGPYGWIIKRSEVERYLEAAPPEVVLKKFHVWHEIHVDAAGNNCPNVRIEGIGNPLDLTDPTLRSITEYTIAYDMDSRVVQWIKLRNNEVAGILTDRSPLQSIKVGKELPPYLKRRE